jgi:hypothetical protein
MKTCIKCGSHAFNLYAEEIDQGGLCDVHYWQGRAHRAEAQPKQEPQVRTGDCLLVGVCASEGHKIQAQRPWVGLTDEEREEIENRPFSQNDWLWFYTRAIEAKLKEKNT